MSRSKSSGRWLQEHFDDYYVNKAKKDGYRSRAVYKLIELDTKDKLFQPGMVVVELGAAPGSWTQYVVERVGDKGLVVASDILPMDAFENVVFVQGDFREDDVLENIKKSIGNRQVDLVISDMAPNMSGMAADQPRAMYLVELALDLATQTLKQGGGFVCKLFQGEGSEAYVKDVKQQFRTVAIKKPKASRPRSREVYVVATGFKGN